MNSIFFPKNKCVTFLHALKPGALFTMITLLFAGVLQAGNHGNFNHSSEGKLDAFSGSQGASINSVRFEDPYHTNLTDTLPREIYHLSLGSDLLHAGEFNYTESSSSATSLLLSRSDSQEWYRTTALFLGATMVLLTFYLAISSLLKNSHSDRIPTGIAPGN